MDTRTSTNTRMVDGKPLLTYEDLGDIIDLTLWAGQLLLQHGAETQRIEETVHRLGTGMGCNWMDIMVSSNTIVVTAISGHQFRTKLRRVPALTINMAVIDAVNTMSRRVSARELDWLQVRAELQRISTMPLRYNRWLVVTMIALSCAAFSRLAGGDWAVFGVTFVAASTAMVVRQELTRRYFNALMIVTITAFIAALIVCSATLLGLNANPELAMAASVLLLVPGVPLINAVEDLIKGHLVTGMAQSMTGILVSACIALGLLLAIWLTGVGGV